MKMHLGLYLGTDINIVFKIEIVTQSSYWFNIRKCKLNRNINW